jgi:two-component system cell cycle sensor histidine kinase/response regulator CckA
MDRMYRSIVALTHEGIWVVDADSRTTFVNRRMEEMLGYEPGEMAGKHITDFLDGEGRSGYAARLERRRQGLAEQSDVRLQRKDGSDLWTVLKSTPLLDDHGRYTGTLGMLTDITDRVKGDRDLRQSESNFRALIEQLPGHVFVHRDAVLLYANPSIVSWLGYGSLQEIVGRTVFDTFVHPDERARVEERIRDIGQSKGTARPTFDTLLVRRDGSVRTVETVAVRLAFDGAPASVILVRDVTDERAMQQRLVLSDRMASVGTLAAGVAHEINNPLTYVISNLEMLLEELHESGPSSAAGKLSALEEIIGQARQGAERVRKIVGGLKTFSRPQDECVALDLQRVLELSVNMATNEIKHRARLVKDYGPAPAVLANEGRLGQVFINLLVNAAQSIAEGHASHNEIRIVTATDARGRAVVEVRDTGRGIPPEALPRIFDPFFTTKAVGGGTGLGLSICHGIVTSLGGDIVVKSRPGEGTVVQVVLPAAGFATADVAKPRVSTRAEAGRRGKVLIVDDDDLVGASLKRVLRREHDVTYVGTGAEALQRLRSEHFDVVLCDLMMPEMTGMELHAEASRSMPAAGERFIFMTGGAFTPTAKAFLDASPNLRFEKPYDAQELRVLLRGFLR